MNERIHEQISAFLDDELSSEESAFLVRRLTSDSIAHHQTIRYSAIGSVLRRESPLASSNILRERIHAVLDGATVAQRAAPSPQTNQTRWARVIAGCSVAASVAVAAVFGLRAIVDTESVPVSAAAVAPSGWTEPESYIVPGDTTPAAPVVAAQPTIRLTNLLIQHGQFASTINRTSVQSNAISRIDAEPADQPLDEQSEP